MRNIILTLITILLFSSCNNKEKKYVYSVFAMDTVFSITLYNKKNPDNIYRESIALLRNLENKYSAVLSSSEVFRLNASHEGETDNELSDIINKSINISIKTKGAFDITVFPLMKLWGFVSKKYRIPSNEEIITTLKKVGYSNIILTNNYLRLNHQAEIDLGGILKGYAVDKMVDFYKSNHIYAGIVNAGGNLKTFGHKPDGTPWLIGIRHPRQLSRLYTVLNFPSDMSIATSGDYERYFITNGIRYCHIISTKTGYPVNNDVVSVSVIFRKAWRTDAYSTALFVMGKKKGINYANKHNIAAMFIVQTSNKQLVSFTSEEWKNLFK